MRGISDQARMRPDALSQSVKISEGRRSRFRAADPVRSVRHMSSWPCFLHCFLYSSSRLESAKIEIPTKGMGSPKTADEADDSCRHSSEREFIMCLLNKAELLSPFAHEPGADREHAVRAWSVQLSACELCLRQQEGS